jgi:hypothetical protein
MSREQYLEDRSRRLYAALAEVEREQAALGSTIRLRNDRHREENLARIASGLPLRPAYLL